MFRMTVLWVAVCAVTGWAAEAVQRDVIITRQNRQKVTGRILNELAKGYLVRTDSGTVVIEFTDIVDLVDAASPATLPPPPPPPPPPPHPSPRLPPDPAVPQPFSVPPPLASDVCEPACRPGYRCSAGQCVSACNPPCTGTDVCTSDLRCVDRDWAEDAEYELKKAANLAELNSAQRGAHFGIAVEVNTMGNTWGFVGGVFNLSFGVPQLRTSLGVAVYGQLFGIGSWPYEVSGAFVVGQLHQDFIFYFGSRFGMGLGGTVGLGYTNVPAYNVGARVMPVVLRFGSRRNLEVSLAGVFDYLSSYQGITWDRYSVGYLAVMNFGVGLYFTYVFY